VTNKSFGRGAQVRSVGLFVPEKEIDESGDAFGEDDVDRLKPPEEESGEEGWLRSARGG